MSKNNISYLDIINDRLKYFKLELQLIAYGNYLAEKNNYPDNISGLEAIYLYLSTEHKWTLTYLRGLCLTDIQSLIYKDLQNFETPPELDILLKRLYVHD